MSVRVTLAFLGLAACGPGELPGEYFTVDLTGLDNQCTGDGEGFKESYEYRIEMDEHDATVSIGEDIFGTGTIEGCQLDYASLVWRSYREDANGTEQAIDWQIIGSARIDPQGGDGCVEGAVDLEGVEQYVILTSGHPDVRPGCTYDVEVSGKWSRTVE